MAQAISRTHAAAPESATSSSRERCDTSSLSANDDALTFLFSFGYCCFDCSAITAISARACSSVTPAAKAADRFHPVVVRPGSWYSLSLNRFVVQNSTSLVGKWNSRGITPMTVYGSLSSIRLWPTIFGSPPNSVCHSR